MIAPPIAVAHFLLLRPLDAARDGILRHAQKLQVERHRPVRRDLHDLVRPVRVLRRHDHPSHRPDAHALDPLVKRLYERSSRLSRGLPDGESDRRPSRDARALPRRPHRHRPKLQVVVHRHARPLRHAPRRAARAL